MRNIEGESTVIGSENTVHLDQRPVSILQCFFFFFVSTFMKFYFILKCCMAIHLLYHLFIHVYFWLIFSMHITSIYPLFLSFSEVESSPLRRADDMTICGLHVWTRVIRIYTCFVYERVYIFASDMSDCCWHVQ